MDNDKKTKLELETALKLLENRIQEEYKDLGKAVIELSDEKAQRINNLTDRVIEIKLKLSKL